jgi:hypothetical protein
VPSAFGRDVSSFQAEDLSIGWRSGKKFERLGQNWTMQGAYELAAATWTPTLTHRYAFFQGDDPLTPANETFDPLFRASRTGGTWWQEEIAVVRPSISATSVPATDKSVEN